MIRYGDELGFDEFFIGELWVEDRVAAGDDIGQGFGPETRIPGKRDELSLMRAQVNFSLTLPSHGPLVAPIVVLFDPPRYDALMPNGMLCGAASGGWCAWLDDSFYYRQAISGKRTGFRLKAYPPVALPR